MFGVIRCIEELERIATEWGGLCERSTAATVFQTPQWLLPWWRHLGGGDILTFTLRDEDRLVGLAPLFLHGIPGETIRQISFIGVGISDYLDFIVEDAFADAFASEIRTFLAQTAADWDVVNLEELREEAYALRLAREQTEAATLSVTAVVTLPATCDDYHRSLESAQRRNIRTACKKLREAGSYRHEVAGPEQFEVFADLHAASWEDRGEPGVVATSALRQFYCESAEALHQIGLLRLHLIHVDKTPVAAILAYHYRKRGYAYLGGFDPAWKKLSPGTALMAVAIERAIEEGLQEWDLLRGDESYKTLWGAARQTNRRIRIQNASRSSP